MNIEYKVLINHIYKSCKCYKDSLKFHINFEKLNNFVDDIGLTLLPIGLTSKAVEMEDIIPISEFFKGQGLSWVNENRHFTQIVFVQTDKIDEECERLMADLETSREDNPDVDKVYALANILANYPCYTATIVSYVGNDPKRYGKVSFEAKCRANTVTIKQDDYQYNHKDMR